MKSYALILIFLPFVGFSQKAKIHSGMNVNNGKMQHHSADVSDSVSTGSFNYYMAVSASISNGDTLSKISYPSIEWGVCYENMMFGINAGRNNFFFSGVENKSNYYWEVKSAVSTKLGIAKGYLLFGCGNYVSTMHYFIEFGSGITMSFGKTDVSLQVSNFDRTDYMSIGVARNF